MQRAGLSCAAELWVGILRLRTRSRSRGSASSAQDDPSQFARDDPSQLAQDDPSKFGAGGDWEAAADAEGLLADLEARGSLLALVLGGGNHADDPADKSDVVSAA